MTLYDLIDDLHLPQEVPGAPACSPHQANLFNRRSERHAQRLERAREICAGCPIRAGCLRYALENDEDGIWGGWTTGERRELAQRVAADNEGEHTSEVAA